MHHNLKHRIVKTIHKNLGHLSTKDLNDKLEDPVAYSFPV